MTTFVVWFMTALWTAETLVSVCGVHGDAVLWVPAGVALVPALLLRWCLARYRLKRMQRAGAWQSPPPLPPAPPPPNSVNFPLLQLRQPFTRAEAIAAFRRQALRCHPDHGGTAALFRMLVAERKCALEMARPC